MVGGGWRGKTKKTAKLYHTFSISVRVNVAVSGTHRPSAVVMHPLFLKCVCSKECFSFVCFFKPNATPPGQHQYHHLLLSPLKTTKNNAVNYKFIFLTAILMDLYNQSWIQKNFNKGCLRFECFGTFNTLGMEDTYAQKYTIHFCHSQYN